jgi:hypothetical protein
MDDKEQHNGKKYVLLIEVLYECLEELRISDFSLQMMAAGASPNVSASCKEEFSEPEPPVNVPVVQLSQITASNIMGILTAYTKKELLDYSSTLPYLKVVIMDLLIEIGISPLHLEVMAKGRSPLLDLKFREEFCYGIQLSTNLASKLHRVFSNVKKLDEPGLASILQQTLIDHGIPREKIGSVLCDLKDKLAEYLSEK